MVKWKVDQYCSDRLQRADLYCYSRFETINIFKVRTFDNAHLAHIHIHFNVLRHRWSYFSYIKYLLPWRRRVPSPMGLGGIIQKTGVVASLGAHFRPSELVPSSSRGQQLWYPCQSPAPDGSFLPDNQLRGANWGRTLTHTAAVRWGKWGGGGRNRETEEGSHHATWGTDVITHYRLL